MYERNSISVRIKLQNTFIEIINYNFFDTIEQVGKTSSTLRPQGRHPHLTMNWNNVVEKEKRWALEMSVTIRRRCVVCQCQWVVGGCVCFIHAWLDCVLWEYSLSQIQPKGSKIHLESPRGRILGGSRAAAIVGCHGGGSRRTRQPHSAIQ